MYRLSRRYRARLLTLLHGVIDSPDIPLNVSAFLLAKRFEREEDFYLHHEEGIRPLTIYLQERP